MEAELKRLHSPDIFDLEKYRPEDSESFCFLLQAFVGPKGEEGEESFDIEVCTPKWLATHFDSDEVTIGQHYLIVREFNYKKISSAIEKFLNHCSGEDWKEVAGKVSRLGRWEFEDYQA